MITLLFILICYGACNNMIYGSIFEGFRKWLAKFGTGGYSLHKLFTCWIIPDNASAIDVSETLLICCKV